MPHPDTQQQSFAGALLQISVSEPLVWRLVDMVQRLDLASLGSGSGPQQAQAATDVPVLISLVSIADLGGLVRCDLCLLESAVILLETDQAMFCTCWQHSILQPCEMAPCALLSGRDGLDGG